MLGAVKKHAEMGVDFVTVHCGVNRSAVDQLSKSNRVTQVVSRGGSMLIEWMHYNGKENPYYEHYDELLSILKENDVTISLGDGLRPGCLADANDRGQIAELVVIGELVERARAEGVQAIVEGPGHVPLDQVRSAVETEKAVCKGAPFYVLGPLVTDVAAGFDHIAAAIGGAVAAWAGADFLCYVTPTEHLGLPDAEDVEIGVLALRVAAHAGDIAKGIPHAREWDDSISEARRRLDWARMIELAIHSPTAKRIRNGSPPTAEEVCTMCSELCAMKTMDGVPWAKKK
jgi:phosphomethylpyrimidine synthase